jgi:Ser/Thr protein kinase RdoA (MazF antagonist)
VLAGRELGTAQLYGAVWDDAGGRHWLLLEFVPGEPSYALENRIAAAAWLGRLRAGVAGQEAELARADVLLRYDGAYFRRTAERARQATASYPGPLGRRLDAVLGGYEAVVGAMTRMPPTLVHGSCRSANVLVDRGRTPPRVCLLDWELAAVGPPLHDLAFLADRFERDDAERLCRAYAAEAAGAGLLVPGTARMLAEIEPLRLHKVLRSLARSAERIYPIEAVTKLVARAEALARDLA